jgi:hypothetical protein
MNERYNDDGMSVIDNYVMAEFVAVTSDFNVETHLSMREKVGVFGVENVNMHNVKLISTCISHSPIFSTMNNPNVNPNTMFFILQLYYELGLIVKSLDNPCRRGGNQDIYEMYSKRWSDKKGFNHIRGQDIKRISFLIVNVCHILSEDVYQEAVTAAKNIQKWQTDIDSVDFNLDEM